VSIGNGSEQLLYAEGDIFDSNIMM